MEALVEWSGSALARSAVVDAAVILAIGMQAAIKHSTVCCRLRELLQKIWSELYPAKPECRCSIPFRKEDRTGMSSIDSTAAVDADDVLPESQELRALHFGDLDLAVAEAKLLLRHGYVRHGKWTLGQICCHLRLTQDCSLDGYPRWMSLFAFARPLMRRLLLPRILVHDSPRGIPTLPSFMPASNVTDKNEVDLFAASVQRFKGYHGPLHPHPAFGRLDRSRMEEVHCAHAAHHLRFLERR